MIYLPVTLRPKTCCRRSPHPNARRGSHGRCKTACYGARPAEAAASPPPGCPIPDLLSADYDYDAQDNYSDFIPLKINLSSLKPGHTTGGSGRGARRGGGAGSGRTRCQQNCSPRGQPSSYLPKASKRRRLNVSPEARTSEILVKPMEERNQRLTRG